MKLLGKAVAENIEKDNRKRLEKLREKGVEARLDIFRIGENPDDLSYERSIKRVMDKNGINYSIHPLDESISFEELKVEIYKKNLDEKSTGILIFRPLPKGLEDKASLLIDPKKDIDASRDENLSGPYLGKKSFYPCTAEAAMEILKYYKIKIEGKRAVVLGRSKVVGRPLSQMLLNENATVTVCHSKSQNLKEIVRQADLVFSCIGKAEYIKKDFIKEGATVIDIGINFDQEGKLVGDVEREASQVAENITPVPGGVGSVTTTILARHLIDAAEESL